MDIIRVLRLIEISGPRDIVEEQVSRSIHGKKDIYTERGELTIRVFTLGEVAEILGQAENTTPEVSE